MALERWVPPQGKFIGSSGMAFVDQTAADIYFKNYFHTQGLNRRIAVICIGWGMSMLYMEEGVRGQQEWEPGDQHLISVVVQDQGVYPALGAPNLPPANLAQAGHQMAHNINGTARMGRTLPWHRRIAVERSPERLPMHYHQHKERKDHTPFVVPPIRPLHLVPPPSHWTFYTLCFGTQVSNYRRAEI